MSEMSPHGAPNRSNRTHLLTDWCLAVEEWYGQSPNICTIFPAFASDEEIMTCWITAEEGSYVSLVSVR